MTSLSRTEYPEKTYNGDSYAYDFLPTALPLPASFGCNVEVINAVAGPKDACSYDGDIERRDFACITAQYNQASCEQDCAGRAGYQGHIGKWIVHDLRSSLRFFSFCKDLSSLKQNILILLCLNQGGRPDVARKLGRLDVHEFARALHALSRAVLFPHTCSGGANAQRGQGVKGGGPVILQYSF